MLWVLVAASFSVPTKGFSCPGSAFPVHASTKVEAIASASCAVVRNEILSRVAKQGQGWHDPHNNGSYSVIDASREDILELKRTTGWPGLFTDKLNFVLEAENAVCVVRGCSESQVFSVSDMSTNYCNLRMLYCGKSDGCRPVVTDFTVTERVVMPSIGAGTNKNACLVVA
mmetsp:Transcript_10854/g.33432  ORF Transcript_10854/g.33432 Transcript_10854/m.33432 type:complete len:171 (-) Transcript_10854:780-1292(-)